MINFVLLIAVLSVMAVAEIIFAVMLFASVRNFNTATEKMNRYTKSVLELSKIALSQADELNKSYGIMRESFDQMIETYRIIGEQHSKLLECWKGVEERYSQSYEQFKHCSDLLNEVNGKLDGITDDGNNLEALKITPTISPEKLIETILDVSKSKDDYSDLWTSGGSLAV